MDPSGTLEDSPESKPTYGDSDTGKTSEDSDGDDDVFSDLEYSRVIPTPTTARGKRARSTPRTPRSTGTRRVSRRVVTDETPIAPRQPSLRRGVPMAGSDHARLAAETQTQIVQPLSATQLQNLGLGFLGEPAQDASPASVGVHGSGNELSASLESDDDERVSSGSEELGTPRAPNTGSGSYGSGGIVDETPMRHQPFNTSQYVYVLCTWQRKWYPARVERVEFEKAQLAPHDGVASVTFGDSSTAMTDLSKSLEFDLRVGDRVQIESEQYRSKKFEVVHLIADDAVASPVRTMSGHSKVSLRALTSSKGISSQPLVVAEAGALSLTRGDADLWMNARNVDGRHNGNVHNDLRRDGRGTEFAGNEHGSPTEQRSVRPKRSRKFDTPDLNRRTSAPRRRKISGSREPSFGQVDDAQATALVPLFKNCVFSISMSDQADDESEELKQLIQQHGGTVLVNGLSDIVKLTEFSDDGDMPSHDMHFEDAVFAAVLAEKPRRTIKYLEMLAVGWPCLMSGFIKECIEHSTLVDWLPWTLPAGTSSLRRKLGALVNANVTEFHRNWLMGENLTAQFVRRRVLLRCTVPICVSANLDTKDRSSNIAEAQRLFLASLCAPQYKLWIYKDEEDVPEGSLLLHLGEKKGQKVSTTEPLILHEMKTLASASKTVKKDASWLLECIINGDLI